MSKALAPGQRREHSGLDIRFDFQCDSTLDLLFTKDQVNLGKDLSFPIFVKWSDDQFSIKFVRIIYLGNSILA